jgi:hypothetical protein
LFIIIPALLFYVDDGDSTFVQNWYIFMKHTVLFHVRTSLFLPSYTLWSIFSHKVIRSPCASRRSFRLARTGYDVLESNLMRQIWYPEEIPPQTLRVRIRIHLPVNGEYVSYLRSSLM